MADTKNNNNMAAFEETMVGNVRYVLTMMNTLIASLPQVCSPYNRHDARNISRLYF